MDYSKNYLQISGLADRLRESAAQKTRGGFAERIRELEDIREDFTVTQANYFKDIQDMFAETRAAQESLAMKEPEAFVGEITEDTVRPVARASTGMESIPGDLTDLAAAREAIAAVESRGSGDYSAVGPVVKKGMYKGQRAYGRYQVMDGNIGPWTKEVLGKAMTREEFLASPEAQDAVVEYQLQKSFQKFGSFDDAASVWFSGQPFEKAKGRSDDNTTVPEYVTKFRKHFFNYKKEKNDAI